MLPPTLLRSHCYKCRRADGSPGLMTTRCGGCVSSRVVGLQTNAMEEVIACHYFISLVWIINAAETECSGMRLWLLNNLHTLKLTASQIFCRAFATRNRIKMSCARLQQHCPLFAAALPVCTTKHARSSSLVYGQTARFLPCNNAPAALRS